jgi:hypothetical protein
MLAIPAASLLPKAISFAFNSMASDAFAKRANELLGRSEVTDGAFTLFTAMATYPISSFLCTMLLVVVVSAVYSTFRVQPKTVPLLTTAPAIAPLVPESLAANVSKELIASAPRLRIDYTPGFIGKLILRNDTLRSPAINVRFGTLRSMELYESDYALNIIPSALSPIDHEHPVECTLYGASNKGADTTNLEEIIARGSSGTLDSVVVDYDDSEGNEFSRRFDLTRNLDGSIAWNPHPVTLRGAVKELKPERKSLVELHQKLTYTRDYDKQKSDAQKYLNLRTVFRNAVPELKVVGKCLLLMEDCDLIIKSVFWNN